MGPRTPGLPRSSGALALAGALVLAACSDDGSGPGSGGDAGTADAAAPLACTTAAPTECTEPDLVYADIAPILEDRCLGCHYGEEGGPWPLTTYPHVAAWYAEIRGAMLSCTMPPPEEGLAMTTDERERLLMWIRCGFPGS